MKLQTDLLNRIIVVILLALFNLIFFHSYPKDLTLTLVTLVTLFNTFFLLIAMTIGHHFSHKDYKRVVHHGKLNNILYNLVQKTSSHSNPRQLYSDILSAAVKAIPAATKGSVMLLDDDGKTLHFMAIEGYDQDILFETFLNIEESFLYRESKGNITKSVLIDDPFEYDRQNIASENMDEILSAGSDNILTTISTPIFVDGKLHGTINVDSPIRHIYTQSDVDIIEIFAYEITNVLKLYKTIEENTYLSSHDILTGIYNRSYFNRYMEGFIKANNPSNFTLVSLDLNDLKKTNDTYGHLIGDQLLITFAKGVEAQLPSDYCFARYGGDEFLILMPNQNTKSALETLHNIKAWFENNPAICSDQPISVQFSYGIAESSGNSSHFPSILQVADEKMYQDKRAYHALHRN